MIEFYNSTGGANWTTQTLPTSSILEVQTFEGYLLSLGEASAASTFNLSALPAATQQLYAVLTELSVNCTLQRQLQLVNLLIKYPWNTAGARLADLLLALCVVDSQLQAVKLSNLWPGLSCWQQIFVWWHLGFRLGFCLQE